MRRIAAEWRLALLALAGAAPAAALILLVALLTLPRWAEWTAFGGALAIALATAFAVRRRSVHAFERLSGLIYSVRDGEYGLRARAERGAFGRVLAAINTLAAELAGLQRAGIESDALLGKLLAAVDLAIFVFDPNDRLFSANQAAARMLGRPAGRLPARSAHELGLGDWLAVTSPLRERRAFPGGEGPWEVRVARFRRSGRPHRLLVVTDLAQALREEERRVWRGLIRVLAHETGNSLGPIQSTADALARRLAKANLDAVTRTGLSNGLDLIERRAKSLSEFIHRYAELARLPAPRPESLDLAETIRRVASLERRVGIKTSGPEGLVVRADPAQLEQALINLVQNAADAALETGGLVELRWIDHDEEVLIEILDEGPGLPESENLFVPFFTTKPGGSGIGLVLARQIVEAHGGSLVLSNRADAPGALVRVRMSAVERAA